MSQKRKLAHDLNDILIECKYNGHACNTTFDFVWSFDEEEYGNCFTFNSGLDSNGNKVNLKQSYLAGPNFGLDLTFLCQCLRKASG